MSEDELDAKKYKIICHLATGCTNKEAAERAGVSLSTVERLKRHPAYKQEFAQAVKEIYKAGLTRLSLGIDTAVSELMRIIESPDTSDRVKLTAIQVLLSNAKEIRQWELEERLETVELKLNGNGAYAIEATKD